MTDVTGTFAYLLSSARTTFFSLLSGIRVKRSEPVAYGKQSTSTVDKNLSPGIVNKLHRQTGNIKHTDWIIVAKCSQTTCTDNRRKCAQLPVQINAAKCSQTTCTDNLRKMQPTTCTDNCRKCAQLPVQVNVAKCSQTTCTDNRRKMQPTTSTDNCRKCAQLPVQIIVAKCSQLPVQIIVVNAPNYLYR